MTRHFFPVISLFLILLLGLALRLDYLLKFPDKYTHLADEPYYHEIARNLREGKGFVVNHIDVFLV